MKSSHCLSQPVELEVILWVLGNDIFPNERLIADIELLVAVAVEQRCCQHKYNTEQKNAFVWSSRSSVWNYTIALEQVHSMSGFQLNKRLM